MAENKSDRNSLFKLQLIKQRNFSELEINIIDLLDSLRQSATSENAMQAALQVDFFCPPLDAEEDEVEAYLWALWEVIAEVARSPDVTSEIHVWLVNFLQNLTQVAKGNHTIWGAEQRVWGDLPLFGQCLDGSYRNIEKDPYLIPEEEYNPVYIEIWRKSSSFAARCTGANILVAYTQAADALRGALEEEVNEIQGIPSTECRILVACEWITHAAKPILLWARQNNGHLDVTKEDAGYIEPGPLYTGPPVVCLQRWGFWQNRFGELGNSEARLREEIRNAVLQAAETMKRIGL